MEEFLLNSKDNYGFILSQEVADNIIDKLIDNGVEFHISEEDIMDILDNNIVVYIEKRNGFYDVVEYLDEDGEPLCICLENIIVDDEIEDLVDFTRIISRNPLVVIDNVCTDESEIELKGEDLINETVNQTLENLEENCENEDFCLHCLLKYAIREAYNLGNEDGREELIDGLINL